MSKYTLSTSQLSAIAAIKAAGFSHAKVELEADLGRGERDSDNCNYCDEGSQECSECYGYGVITENTISPNGTDREVTALCETCEGDGQVTCSDCMGDWEGSSSEWSDYDCKEFLLQHVSPEAAQMLTYSRFYDDGSVDSEFTYTFPIDQLHLATEFLTAFVELSDAIGNSMETSGAGMHLAILPSGDYPSSVGLDSAKLDNFTAEVTKLLPALYFVASPDYKSRSLTYRNAEISPYEKYSAIYTHDGTCMEFRIFETCYERPTALLENFEVIAATLKYYADPTAKVNIAPVTLDGSRRSEGLARFFQTPELLRSLNAGLRIVKPKDKTIAALKSERNFKLTVKDIQRQDKINRANMRNEYAEYLESAAEHNYASITEALIQRDHLRVRSYTPEQISRYLTSIERFYLTPEADTEAAITAELERRGSIYIVQSFSRWYRNQSQDRRYSTT